MADVPILQHAADIAHKISPQGADLNSTWQEINQLLRLMDQLSKELLVVVTNYRIALEQSMREEAAND